MSQSVTITVPLPPRGISPNASRRLHWAAKGKLVKAYRQEGWLAGYQAQNKHGIERIEFPVIIDQEWFMGPTTDARERPRDEDNCRACLKPIVDGLVDSKLLKGDTTRLVGWGTYKAHRTAKEHSGRAEVVLTLRIVGFLP